MRAVSWTISLLLLATVGCGASAAEPDAKTTSAALDGVYFASTGPNTWASFKDATYVTWSSEPRCVDVDTAPADCAEKGSFAIDGAKGEVVFTSEAGKITVRKMAVNESVSSDGLVTTKAFHFADLVGNGQGLVDSSGAATVASNVSLVEPGQTQLAANTFQKFGIVCRVVGLILNPINQPVIVPPSPPPPITQQQCASQG